MGGQQIAVILQEGWLTMGVVLIVTVLNIKITISINNKATDSALELSNGDH